MQHVRPSRRRRRGRRLLIGLGAVLPLISCSSREQLADLGPGDVVDSIRNVDLTAHYASPTGGPGFNPHAPAPRLYPGASPQVAARTVGGAVSDGTAPDSPGGKEAQGIELNFEAADIASVAKSILGDTLNLTYAIDPRVQGSITLSSNGPIQCKDALAVFESALRMNNVALIHEAGLIRLVPLPEALGTGSIGHGIGQAGYGVTIIPMHFTSATMAMKTAENFLARPQALRADEARNILFVQGSSAERQTVIDTVASLDVDWMRHQSVGIYPLKATAPETMIKELEKVFASGEGGQGQGTIHFQPIARMNAVMAVARNARLLTQATQWIRRLDTAETSGTTVRVYQLENGDAKRIAKILNDLFVGRGGAGSGESAASQLTPGSNAAQSKLDSISSASSFSSNASSSSSQSSGSGGSGSNSGLGSGKTQSAFSGFADGKDDDKDSKDQTQTGSGGPPKGMFQNVRITADVAGNSIVIFSNQEDYDVIVRSLRDFDRPQLQVAIQATVAEVTLTDSLQYGVQYFLRTKADIGSFNLTTGSSAATLSRTLPGANLVLGSEASPSAVISALSSLTHVKVLSAPSLVVTDNQPASLQVGDSVPISTGSATVLSSSNTVVNTITMQDTGVILKVWPHVHENGNIQLEVEQEISNVVNQDSSSSTTNLNPTISERRVHSTVSVNSGQTVLLGGLISDQDNKTQTGVPVLRNIRFIGDLFGSTSDSKTRTEIIIFIKPEIIRNGFDAQSVAEEFRSRLDTMHSGPAAAADRSKHAIATKY